jgi:hypothetical protein
MFTGLALYFTYPKISHGELLNSIRKEFALKPSTNKTAPICWSLNQLFYFYRADNLILNNSVFIEVNSSGPVTLYRQDYNVIVKLAENITFYNSTLLDTRAETKLIIVSEAGENVSVNVRMNCNLSVRTVDLTLQRKGFRIFTITLLISQILSLIINKCFLVASIVPTIAYKLSKESLLIKVEKEFKLMGVLRSIMEFQPIIIIIYYYWDEYHEMEAGKFIGGPETRIVEMSILYPYLDAISRVYFIGFVVSYLIITLFHFITTMGYYSIHYRVLKKRGESFLRIFAEVNRDALNRSKKTLALYSLGFISSSIGLLTLLESTPLVHYALYTIILLLLLSAYPMIYKLLKDLRRASLERGLNEFFPDFVETSLKMMSFSVILFIALFVMLSAGCALYIVLLDSVVYWEPLPRLALEILEAFKQSLKERFTEAILFSGRLQVTWSAFFVTYYWAAKIIVCKLELSYRVRVLKDIAFSLVVTGISEYLLWSYYYFTLHQSYTPFNPPISILIGLTSSIVEEMFREL